LKANSTLFLTNLAVAKSCPVTPRPGKCRQNVSRRAARMRWDFMTSEFLKPNHKTRNKEMKTLKHTLFCAFLLPDVFPQLPRQ
jgi:hypothetical protein